MKSILCYPCNAPFVVSQRFGENYDYYFKNFKQKGHNGWDFALPIGTKLYATHDGIISFSSVTNFGDLAISIIDVSGTFRTIYGHLSESKVKVGDVVKKGQLVCLSGNTGRYTSGPHLHFGIHEVVNGVDINLDNGFSGGVDPAKGWDGTYPSNYSNIVIPTPTSSKEFLEMQSAILAFQLSEGITVFKNKPLNTVLYGPATLSKAKKYLK